MNLISHFPAVRNQGTRPTCTAHAVGALMDFHLGGDQFGPQYIYWLAKETDGDANGPGTWIENCVAQMCTGGAARDKTWPYNPAPGVTQGQGPPPAAAVSEAALNLLSSTSKVAQRDIPYGVSSAMVMACLDEGVPVALSVVSPPDLWIHDEQVQQSGVFTMPLPGSAAGVSHAVCAVGYGIDTDFAGDAYVIIRNSWGTDFYEDGPFGPGYAVLPAAYLDEWGLEAHAGPR